MAENPKKKTENAADAPSSSGAAPTPAAAAPVPTSAPVPEPKARANDQEESEVDYLRRQLQGARAEIDDRKSFMAEAIKELGAAVGKGVADALEAQRQAKLPGNIKKGPKREIPEKFKGPRTYIVGPKGAFQGVRRFVQGERITIVDQFPSRDWTPVESVVETPAQAPAVKQGRASDQTVG